jgi:hypothetical protein
MNFLIFRPFAFIISKKIRLHLFELIKDEAALKEQYTTLLAPQTISIVVV